MNECNCTVAMGAEFDEITATDALMTAIGCLDRFNEWKKGDHASAMIIQKKNRYNLYQHLNSGYYCFEFCPKCGREIDWNNILPD